MPATNSPVRSPTRSPLRNTMDNPFSSPIGFTNQSAEFGALTLAGDGGYQVVSSTTITSASITGGDPSGHFSISSAGVITVSAAGDTANLSGSPYSLTVQISDNGGNTATGTVTITAIANAYSAASNTDIKDAFTAIGTASGGARSVYLRSGIYTTDAAIFLNRAFVNQVTVRSHDTSNKAIMRQQTISGSNNVRLYQLEIFDETITNGSGLIIGDVASRPQSLTIEECVMHGIYRDINGDYSALSSWPGNANGTSGSINGATFKNNIVYDVETGIQFTLIQGNLEISGNVVYNYYDDGIKLSGVDRTGTTTKVNDNVLYGGISNDGDNGGGVSAPHCDGIQFVGLSMTHDWPGIEIYRNRLLNNARGEGQGIFLDDAPAGLFFTAKIKGNTIIIKENQNGILITRAKNCEIIGNTIAKFTPLSGQGEVPRISIGGSEASGKNKVWNNIAEAVTTNSSYVPYNNIVLGEDGGTIAYTTVFDGPTFSPASIAEVMTKFDSGSYGIGKAGSIGTGYVTYSSVFPGQSGQAFDTSFEAPTISNLSGVGDGGTDAHLEMNTNDSDGTIYWYVSTSATPPSVADLKAGTGSVSFGSFAVTAYDNQPDVDIAGLSALTNYYAHVVHTNAIPLDSSIATSAVFTTAVSPYTPTAIWLDGTSILTNSSYSLAAAKKYLISFWFKAPTAYITGSSRTLLALANSGGTDRLRFFINTNSRLQVDVGSTTTTDILTYATPTNTIPVGSWYHVAFAMDTTVPDAQLYINGSAMAIGTPTLNADVSAINRIHIPDNNTLGEDIYFSEIYINHDAYLDLDTPANLAKFISSGDPVYLGSSGSRPTGSSPSAYFKLAGTSFNQNQGTGADLTLTGTLAAAPDAP